MAGESIEPLEHSALEADMERLVLEVRKHRERPEMKGRGDRELIKEALRSLPDSSAAGDEKDENRQEDIPHRKNFLPDYVEHFPAEEKLEVEYLLDLSHHKGLLRANAEAKKAQPAVQDAFHDSMAIQLHSELERRGAFQ